MSQITTPEIVVGGATPEGNIPLASASVPVPPPVSSMPLMPTQEGVIKKAKRRRRYPPACPPGASAVIYTRFSPRPDAATSESCDNQESMCRRFAEAHDMVVKYVFNDPDRSGSDCAREKLWDAINSLSRGWTLLVWKRDRIARSVYLSEAVNRLVSERGARIMAIEGDLEGDTPETILVRQIVAAMSEYERKAIAARTKSAMRIRMLNGQKMGRFAPYGWHDVPGQPGRIEKDEEEQMIINEMVAKREAGISFRRISNHLAARGILNRQGHPFAAKTIMDLIARAKEGRY